MDDDALNRKEAVAGLGFLGALMLALIGVIVYRIVGARPVAPRFLGGTTFAGQTLGPAQPTAPTTGSDAPTIAPDALTAAPAATPIVHAEAATPIPTAGEANFESAPLTSGVEPPPPNSAAVQPTPAEPQHVERPTFVAPGSRALQP